MINEISIKNFKSIANDTISLGRINVFIGENGCGKSNILEAVAFASALKKYNVVDADILYLNNIRVTKPNLMVNQFEESEKNNIIDIRLKINDREIKCLASPESDDIRTKWGIHELFSDEEVKAIEKLYNLKRVEEIGKFYVQKRKEENFALEYLNNFSIYTLQTQVLRGINHYSQKGLFGENLDEMIANLNEEETQKLKSYTYFVEWFEDFLIDEKDTLKLQGHKLNHSKSLLYFRDKFMPNNTTFSNVFSSENANEGILHVDIKPALQTDETDKNNPNNPTIGTLQGVKNACQANENAKRPYFEKFFFISDENFIVIHLDTTEIEKQDFSFKKPQKTKENIEDYSNNLREIVINLIDGWLDNQYKDELLYAIAIEETEAWFLAYFEKNTENSAQPKEKLNKLLAQKSKSKNDILKEFRKVKNLEKILTNNQSLLNFINSIKEKI